MFSFNRTKTGELSFEEAATRPTETRATDHGPAIAGSEDVAVHLRALGLPPDASWEEATVAYRRLISDLTPGPDASHSNLALAQRFLHEVNHAYASLRVLAVA